MNIVNVEHISKQYGEKQVFDDASFGIQEGDKIGIVGINGTGKTTRRRRWKSTLWEGIRMRTGKYRAF